MCINIFYFIKFQKCRIIFVNCFSTLLNIRKSSKDITVGNYNIVIQRICSGTGFFFLLNFWNTSVNDNSRRVCVRIGALSDF